MSTTKKHVWMSFDLGIDGDYDALYKMLDWYGAKECGDNIASFEFPFDGGDLEKALLAAIPRTVKKAKRARIYVIYRESKPSGGSKVKGRWIVGARRAAPWAGYSVIDEGADDEG